MSWLGAGIGAGIGLAVGGPIGAGIGAWIGSKIGNQDKKQLLVACPHCNQNVGIQSEGRCTCPHCNALFTYGDTENNQTLFFVALCSMLAKMAKADSVVCKNEISTVTKFFDQMGLDSEDKKSAIIIFNNAKTDDTTIYEYAKQYSEFADYEMLEMVYSILWQVALADGKLHKNEELILKNITVSLGIPETRYHEYKTNTQNTTPFDIEECYKTLGCTAGDTNQVVKQKYRKAVSEYHPDKIQSKGLPKGFHEFATEQMQKINRAYEKIKAHREIT